MGKRLVYRHFIGGIANGERMKVPEDYTMWRVPHPPRQPHYASYEGVSRQPNRIDDYLLRQVISPHGKPQAFMVLRSISEDELLQILNTHAPNY